MLGLASMIRAMLAGVAAASKELTFCSTPFSHTRKSFPVSPRTRVPFGAVTVHCTSTSATRERMTDTGSGNPDLDSPDGDARNSPVDASRESGTSFSSIRGRGSFGFCAVQTRATIKFSARRMLIRGWSLAGRFIEHDARLHIGGERLFQIKIAQRLFGCRLFVGFLERLFELSSQDVFSFVFGFPRFAKFVLAASRLLRQNSRRIRNIHIRSRFWRRRMRQNRS